MKQVLLLTLFLYFIYTPLKSQSKWSWGIQTEIGISGTNHDKNESVQRANTETIVIEFTRQAPSIGGGIWVQHHFKSHINLRSGLQYVNTGEYNGNSRHSRLLTTNQEVSYYSNTNSFRVHRLQLPFLVEYQIGKSSIKPTIGIGVVWSKDIVKNITEKIINTSAEQYRVQKPRGFPSSIKIGSAQPMFTFGAKITDQLSVEFKHLFARKPKDISWIIDPNIDPNSIQTPAGFIPCHCFSYSKIIKTHYHQSNSLVFKYRL